MANFGPLTAEIVSETFGTPANFNGFRVLASLLQRRHWLEANQTLHLCTTFGRLLGWYTIYTFSEALAPDGILPRAKFTLRPKSCVLLYWQRYCMALKRRVSAKICSMLQGMKLRNFRTRRHL